MPAECPPPPHTDDADGALVSSAHTAGLLLQSSDEIRTVGRRRGGQRSREETEYKFQPRRCQLVPAELEDKHIWAGIQEAETLRA